LTDERDRTARPARDLRRAGRRLYVGEATVKTHLLRAFTKRGVSDRTATVTTALARGILGDF
jgi:DNA-binding NarL/FixJ family response regulator